MLAAQIHSRIAEGSPFFSLEFYPPFKDERESVESFIEMLRYLEQSNPVFVDITWTRRNDPGNLKRLNSSTAICIAANSVFGANRTMLHLCCNGYAKHETLVHLEQARHWGIKSILALGGDQEEPNMPMEKLHYAIDLVKWARQFQPKKNGCVNVNGGGCEELTLGIAGHIQPPLKEVSYGQYLLHLRNKVQAGADFIISQFFLDVRQFEKFCNDCRLLGITLPILPGILLFKSSSSLKKIAELANVPIPLKVAKILAANKENTQAVQNYALHLALKMCRQIFANKTALGVHIFTMNQRIRCGILLRQLGFWPTVERSSPFLRINEYTLKRGHEKQRKKTEENEVLINPIFMWRIYA